MILLPRKIIYLRNAQPVHATKLRLQMHFDASANLAAQKKATYKESKNEAFRSGKADLNQHRKGSKYGDVHFVGTIEHQRFHMVKLDMERNSFSPVISGHLKEVKFGTEITAHAKLPFVMIKLALAWYVLTGISAFVTVPLYFRLESGSLFLFAPLLLFVSMVFLVHVGFAQGTHHIQQQLEKLLDARMFK